MEPLLACRLPQYREDKPGKATACRSLPSLTLLHIEKIPLRTLAIVLAHGSSIAVQRPPATPIVSLSSPAATASLDSPTQWPPCQDAYKNSHLCAGRGPAQRILTAQLSAPRLMTLPK